MITKWSSNPYIKGAWSYARVNSSVEDRHVGFLDLWISIAVTRRMNLHLHMVKILKGAAQP